MSSKTENLELFKYDPVADKDQTFNIELALNQNWDKVDKEIAQREGLLRSSAVKEGVSDTDAIAIVDDADSSKTKRVLWSTIKSALSKIYVPLARKINSKSLSSDVILTGADIQVSGTDNTKIDAALSNKLSNQIQERVQIPDGSNLQDFLIGKPYGHYYVFGEDLIDGMPTTERVWWFIWYVSVGVFAISDNTRELWHAEFTNGLLLPWKMLSTATPPREGSLPLAEDIIVYPGFQATYHRNQFGEVTVILTVKKQDDSPITYGEVIATLPAGYRPSAIIAVSAEGQVQTGVFGSNLTIQVHPDGRIVFYTSGGSGAIDLGACITFLASS